MLLSDKSISISINADTDLTNFFLNILNLKNVDPDSSGSVIFGLQDLAPEPPFFDQNFEKSLIINLTVSKFIITRYRYSSNTWKFRSGSEIPDFN